MHDTDTKLLQTLIRGFDRVMLVSRCDDVLRSRPMRLAQRCATQKLWLLPGISGDSLDELAIDANVNVVMQSCGRFCSVSGTARVLREAIGDDGPEEWERVDLPYGPLHSPLVLVEVAPSFAEYWDRSGVRGLRFKPQREVGPAPGSRVRAAKIRPLTDAREPNRRKAAGANVIELEAWRRRR